MHNSLNFKAQKEKNGSSANIAICSSVKCQNNNNSLNPHAIIFVPNLNTPRKNTPLNADTKSFVPRANTPS